LEHQVAAPNAVEFANFADTLYGQARGGVRWTQAAIDHPELNSMVEPDRSRLLYRLAVEEIVRNPFGLVQGSLKAFVDFNRPGSVAGFGFLAFGNKLIDFIFQVATALVFLFGLWKIWMSRKNRINALILAYWAGTLFSIPFLPPIDAGVRPYAATIASLFLPVCFVFSQSLFRRLENSPQENQIIPVSTSYTLAFTVLLLPLIGAPLLKAIATPIHVQSTVCESDLIPINFRINHGSYILLASANEARKTKVPVVLITDVHGSFDDFPYGDFASIIRKIKQPVLMAEVNDTSTGEGKWIIAPAELNAYEGQIVSGCAKLVFPIYSVWRMEVIANP
jgi:hypothetical protein